MKPLGNFWHCNVAPLIFKQADANKAPNEDRITGKKLTNEPQFPVPEHWKIKNLAFLKTVEGST